MLRTRRELIHYSLAKLLRLGKCLWSGLMCEEIAGLNKAAKSLPSGHPHLSACSFLQLPASNCTPAALGSLLISCVLNGLPGRFLQRTKPPFLLCWPSAVTAPRHLKLGKIPELRALFRVPLTAAPPC